VLTDASVFIDINDCDWQTAVTVLLVVVAFPLLLLFVTYRGYG